MADGEVCATTCADGFNADGSIAGGCRRRQPHLRVSKAKLKATACSAAAIAGCITACIENAVMHTSLRKLRRPAAVSLSMA